MCLCFVYHYYQPFGILVSVLSSVIPLSSLAGEMEGKEHEHEEN